MPPGLDYFGQVLFETLTLFVLLVGLFGLIVPVFPGLTIMWLAAVVYALIQNARGLMTGWDWFLFAVMTLLMVAGNIVDSVIIAAKMRDKYKHDRRPAAVSSPAFCLNNNAVSDKIINNDGDRSSG